MPLPEKVIEQLGKETDNTPGWAPGVLLFSGGMLALAILIYVGLSFGYEPYLEKQLSSTQTQVTALSNSVSASDQSQLINYYSQISNLQTLLQTHVISTQFFTWLENNTEANIYYQSAAISGGDSVSLSAVGATEADVNQQIAIFENSPEVSAVSVSGVNPPPPGTVGGWNFSISLSVSPSLFLASTQ